MLREERHRDSTTLSPTDNKGDPRLCRTAHPLSACLGAAKDERRASPLAGKVTTQGSNDEPDW